MKDSFVFLADGFEEIEAISVIDILRRAGMPVKTVSITSSLQVKGAHGIIVVADAIYDSTLFTDAEWLIFPGGLPGATNLYEFAPLQGLIKNQAASESGRMAAICAAPGEVLGQLGVLNGEKFTCYPGFEGKVDGGIHEPAKVVVSGKYVTANGPSSATLWALEIVKETLGEDKASEVASGMLLYPLQTSQNTVNMFG
ncbi:MAG: DJ-1/PfpI family protein [Muribaculaceae bacterium]|nr:DJ-1/PfpI family protein [Muribaculaceae bacterium]MDE6553506.1 DJ-1/PfpI family protein [Muribaculaceae bacterium]